MTEKLNSLLDSPCTLDKALLGEFGQLWAEAEDLWDRDQDTAPFARYVSADYLAVYESLRATARIGEVSP